MSLAVRVEDPDQPAVRAFLAASDALMAALYPAESNHMLDLAALRGRDVMLLVTRIEGDAVGCGALVRRAGYAEIKRMWVEPAWRGGGIGGAILAELERLARLLGLATARLETGIRNPDAIALYRRAGYRPTGPFGDYRPDPLSLFMAKDLAADG